MFSERNLQALDDPANTDWGCVPQDDYNTWPGERGLVQNPTGGAYAGQGWIEYEQHRGGANYLFYDGHAKWMRWSQA